MFLWKSSLSNMCVRLFTGNEVQLTQLTHYNSVIMAPSIYSIAHAQPPREDYGNADSPIRSWWWKLFNIARSFGLESPLSPGHHRGFVRTNAAVNPILTVMAERERAVEADNNRFITHLAFIVNLSARVACNDLLKWGLRETGQMYISAGLKGVNVVYAPDFYRATDLWKSFHF